MKGNGMEDEQQQEPTVFDVAREHMKRAVECMDACDKAGIKNPRETVPKLIAMSRAIYAEGLDTFDKMMTAIKASEDIIADIEPEAMICTDKMQTMKDANGVWWRVGSDGQREKMDRR